jgi:hypothetical protein
MENNEQQESNEELKPEKPVQEKTAEELAWEEQLKQRLEELRKRDPFIYR